MIGAGLCLLPWLVYLAVSLPASPRAWHWPAAWAGLDALEAAGLISTGLLLRRGDSRYCLTRGRDGGVPADRRLVRRHSPRRPELASWSRLVMALAAELPARRRVRRAGACAESACCSPARSSAAPRPARSDRLSARARTGHRLGRPRACTGPGAGRRPRRDQLHAAPGNPGIAALAEQHQLTATDPVAVADLAAWLRADLVVVGPEAPLVAGRGRRRPGGGHPLLRARPGRRDDRGLQVLRQGRHEGRRSRRPPRPGPAHRGRGQRRPGRVRPAVRGEGGRPRGGQGRRRHLATGRRRCGTPPPAARS